MGKIRTARGSITASVYYGIIKENLRDHGGFLLFGIAMKA